MELTNLQYDIYGISERENIFEHYCPNEKAKLFDKYLQAAMDANCPVVHRKLKSKHSLWYNDDIRKAKDEKFAWLRLDSTTPGSTSLQE